MNSNKNNNIFCCCVLSRQDSNDITAMYGKVIQAVIAHTNIIGIATVSKILSHKMAILVSSKNIDGNTNIIKLIYPEKLIRQIFVKTLIRFH